ncbi:ImmA/IrrE family metallo-endopeptidase [Alkalibacter rhizosphaerae]|uniref:ImmA/IrrE family metallo-endopeptidase n=1 Tax=Alkalibacter rhizosphaerae TaxID=2815577 RepID=UPI001FEEE2B5|nr:ImmA/IrrE family metallo-endopeptidase [Alkalibacter rhizosphaerae]
MSLSISLISKEVKRIQNKYRESDPFRLCRLLGISLLFSPMGSHPEDCKGFYLYQSRKQAIVLNEDLPEALQRIILAHELGHGILHRKASGLHSFHDFVLFDETSVYEYEANIFAADLLLEDSKVLSLLNDDLSFFQAAAKLKVPAELLDFKFRVLKRKGYKVVDPPFVSSSNFLKNYSEKE